MHTTEFAPCRSHLFVAHAWQPLCVNPKSPAHKPPWELGHLLWGTVFLHGFNEGDKLRSHVVERQAPAGVGLYGLSPTSILQFRGVQAEMPLEGGVCTKALFYYLILSRSRRNRKRRVADRGR